MLISPLLFLRYHDGLASPCSFPHPTHSPLPLSQCRLFFGFVFLRAALSPTTKWREMCGHLPSTLSMCTQPPHCHVPPPRGPCVSLAEPALLNCYPVSSVHTRVHSWRWMFRELGQLCKNRSPPSSYRVLPCLRSAMLSSLFGSLLDLTSFCTAALGTLWRGGCQKRPGQGPSLLLLL